MVSAGDVLLVGEVEGITSIVVIVGLKEEVVFIGDVVNGIMVTMGVLFS